jgi:hypothetical protein
MNNGHTKQKNRLDCAIKQYLLNPKKANSPTKADKPTQKTQSRNHSNLNQSQENKQIFNTLQANSNMPTHETQPPKVSLKYTSERGATISSTQSSPSSKHTYIHKKIEITNQFINSDPLNVSFSKKQPPHFTIVERLYIRNIIEFHQIRETVKSSAGGQNYPTCMERGTPAIIYNIV